MLVSLMQRTVAIIKPNAFSRKEEIKSNISLDIIEESDTQLSEYIAREFYKEHENKDFFEDLIAFMTSGKCTILLLEGEGAVSKWREQLSLLRPQHTENSTKNGLHGSDSEQSAKRETQLLFPNYAKFIPSDEEIKKMLEEKVYPTLTRGLVELCKEKPLNPCKWLGEWIQSECTST